MFSIRDGRAVFWQWDTNRQLIVNVDCNEVHMSNDSKTALVLIPYEDGGVRVVDVPNVFLQQARPIEVFVFLEDDEGGYTKHSDHFFIHPRSKPDDYVYTETEVLSYRTIDERMRKLETSLDEQVAESVGKYLEENPAKVGLPPVTEQDNGKILVVTGGKWAAAKLPSYDGVYSVTPSATDEQTLKTAQTFVDADVKIEKIPYSEVSNNAGGTTATIGGN